MVIANRKIANVDELALEVNPEFGNVLRACPEIIEDLIDRIRASRGMAALDFAPDDRFDPCNMRFGPSLKNATRSSASAVFCYLM